MIELLKTQQAIRRLVAQGRSEGRQTMGGFMGRKRAPQLQRIRRAAFRPPAQPARGEDPHIRRVPDPAAVSANGVE